MIDLHHDLLSIMYYCYLKDDYDYLENWIKNFNKGNVSGLLANLYYMSPEEMQEEMGNTKINVVEMFKKGKELFHIHFPIIDDIDALGEKGFTIDDFSALQVVNVSAEAIFLVGC